MKFREPLFAVTPQFARVVIIATDGNQLFKMFGDSADRETLIKLAKLEDLKPLYIYNVYPKLPGYALAS